MRKLNIVSSSTIRQQENSQDSPNNDLSFIKGVLRTAGGTALGVSLLATSLVAGGLVGLAISFRNLPDVRTLRNYSPSETSYVYDIKGRLLTRLHGEANREGVTLEKISPELKRAVLAIEDSHFYLHQGFKHNSIGRELLVNWKCGCLV